MASAMLLALVASLGAQTQPAADAGRPGVNLIPNAGFDAPDKHGWSARGKPITVDPNGAYMTPCLRVEYPEDVKHPEFYFVRSGDIPALPNRTYLFKCIVKTAHTAGEARPAVRLIDAKGASVAYKRVSPLTAGTRDWHEQRIEFTTPATVATMQIYLVHRHLQGVVWYDECVLTLAPPRPAPSVGSGAAVTFPGGPGELDMRVEHVAERDGEIVVRTTGARYAVDVAKGVIAGSQRIGVQRPSVRIEFPRGLAGLRILKQDATVCVLTTGAVDIGIQCDSLVVIAARDRQPVTCHGRLGGVWARCEEGHVLAIDDHGGVGVYPHVISGSGVRMEAARQPEDLTRPGWTCTHTIGASRRLGVSIFPPREFDWEKSFKWRLCHTGCAQPPDHVLQRWARHATHVCLHSTAMWKSARSHIGPYETKDPAGFRRVIAAGKRLGMTTMPYMSPWYYPVRSAEVFIDQLARHRAAYGYGGVYYDGLWYDDWIESYRVMRMTRALFPKGCVYLHSTIGPPLFSKTMWCPFLDTYADFVLRGEGYRAKGPGDPYVRYVAAGYRTSNAIGFMKGDKWDVDAKTQKQVMLGYNGRGRWATYPGRNEAGEYIWPGQLGPLRGFWVDWYFPELERLERVWRAGGRKP